MASGSLDNRTFRKCRVFIVNNVNEGMVRLFRFSVGFRESGGSLWVMGEWSVGHWIMGVMSFQKIYGLFSLKHHTAEISEDVTDAGRTTTKGKLR